MCTLGEGHGKEMQDIVNILNGLFKPELDNLFSQHKEGDIIKKIWENDAM